MTDTQLPTWTLGDRLRKAREHAGIGQGDMARELGVSRNTLTGYEHDARTPRRAVLLAYALRCAVPLEWIETGDDLRSRCFAAA